MVNEADTVNLVKTAEVILGLNSTTLLEGVLANKLLISPDMRHLFEKSEWDYFSGHQDLIRYARDYAELERLIYSAAEFSSHDEESRKKFLESYIYMADGHACQRVSDQILHTIKYSSNLSSQKT